MIKEPGFTIQALARALLVAGAAATKDERDAAMALADTFAANLNAVDVEKAHRYSQQLAECADAVEEERERMTEDDLIRVWSAFCAIEGLTCYSADEVILRDDLTTRQRSFVSTFILLWSHAV